MIMLLAMTLSVAIGVVLGMLGGGGAILTLPMLVYAVGLEPKSAIATSLFVVGSTSVVGATLQARAGNVRYKHGGTFAIAAMIGAYAGGRLAHFVAAPVLLVLFGVVMVMTATAMLHKRNGQPTNAVDTPARTREFRLLPALGLGSLVGVLSGLVGAGGGFLIVPALTIFGGLAMREAIGTSLLVIALQSFSAFAGHVSHATLDWSLMLGVTGASVLGSAAGTHLGKRLSAASLRRAFAGLVIAMGLFMFAKQLPPLAALGAGALTLVAVLFAARAPSPSPSSTADSGTDAPSNPGASTEAHRST